MTQKELIVPDFLKFKGKTLTKKLRVINNSVKSSNIATVCEEANCPNKTECWSSGTATFMLMGDTCTRNCRFCSVKSSENPNPLDPNEPLNLVNALKDWKNIDYIVITSVDRDDLEDGGSNHLAKCINAIRKFHPNIRVEILIPDFRGNEEQIQNIIDCKPEVIAHNIETVERLSKKVRDRLADYQQSLKVLKFIKSKNPDIITKSSIMIGLSEKKEDIINTLTDLKANKVDIVTIGQYMRPNLKNLAVKEYVSKAKFEEYYNIAIEMGFKFAVSQPLSRSSYKANEAYDYISNNT